jgi:hypothetical protein
MKNIQNALYMILIGSDEEPHASKHSSVQTPLKTGYVLKEQKKTQRTVEAEPQSNCFFALTKHQPEVRRSHSNVSNNEAHAC